jgi:hypothetical protein
MRCSVAGVRGLLLAAAAVLLLPACGGTSSARQHLGRLVVDYVDRNANHCCVSGLQAYDPNVRISKIDPNWATVHVNANDKAGQAVQDVTFVMHREKGSWNVATFGSALLGCGVPEEVRAELRLVAAHCSLGLPSFVACGEPATVRPHAILFACADGNFYVDHLRWASWSAPSASAVGIAHQNDCIPDCAGGHFHLYPDTSIRVWRPETCGKRRLFTRIEYRFLQRTPPNEYRRVTLTAPFLYKSRCG